MIIFGFMELIMTGVVIFFVLMLFYLIFFYDEPDVGDCTGLSK